MSGRCRDGLRHGGAGPVEDVVGTAARAGGRQDLALGNIGEILAKRRGEPVVRVAEGEGEDILGKAVALHTRMQRNAFMGCNLPAEPGGFNQEGRGQVRSGRRAG